MSDSKQAPHNTTDSDPERIVPIAIGQSKNVLLHGQAFVGFDFAVLAGKRLSTQDLLGPALVLVPGKKLTIYGKGLSHYNRVLLVFKGGELVRSLHANFFKFSNDGSRLDLTTPNYGDEHEPFFMLLASTHPDFPLVYVDQRFYYQEAEDEEESKEKNKEQEKAEAAQKQLKENEKGLTGKPGEKKKTQSAQNATSSESNEIEHGSSSAAPVDSPDVGFSSFVGSLAKTGALRVISGLGAGESIALAATQATASAAQEIAKPLSSNNRPDASWAVQKGSANQSARFSQGAGVASEIARSENDTIHKQVKEQSIDKMSEAATGSAPQKTQDVENAKAEFEDAGKRSAGTIFSGAVNPLASAADQSLNASDNKAQNVSSSQTQTAVQPSGGNRDNSDLSKTSASKISSSSAIKSSPVPKQNPLNTSKENESAATVPGKQLGNATQKEILRKIGKENLSSISGARQPAGSSAGLSAVGTAEISGVDTGKTPETLQESIRSFAQAKPRIATQTIESTPQYQEIKKKKVAEWAQKFGGVEDKAGTNPALTEYKALRAKTDSGLTVEQEILLEIKQHYPEVYIRFGNFVYETSAEDPVVQQVEIKIAQKREELLSLRLPPEQVEIELDKYEELQWDDFVEQYPEKAQVYALGDKAIGEAIKRQGGEIEPLDKNKPSAGKPHLSEFDVQIQNLGKNDAALKQKLALDRTVPKNLAESLEQGAKVTPGVTEHAHPKHTGSTGIQTSTTETKTTLAPNVQIPPAITGQEQVDGLLPQTEGGTEALAEGERGAESQATEQEEQDIDELNRLARNSARADRAVIAGNSLVNKAASSAAGKKIEEKLVGQATSKVWYYGFGSSAATFFTGFDLMLGALVMDFYWVVLHRRNPELFPMKAWQKAVTVLANIIPPIFVLLFFIIIFFSICNSIVGNAALYALVGENVCKNFDVTNTGGSIVTLYDTGTGNTTLTGSLTLSQLKPAITTAATQYSLDPCVLTTVIAKESGGNTAAIGHDSHSKSADPFDPNSPPLYGLDWKYSHGIGLTQWTIFPSSRIPWIDASTPSRRLFGVPSHPDDWYTIPDLLNPTISLELTSKSFSDRLKNNGGDLQAVFGAYNGSGREGTYAQQAMTRYNLCKEYGN